MVTSEEIEHIMGKESKFKGANDDIYYQALRDLLQRLEDDVDCRREVDGPRLSRMHGYVKALAIRGELPREEALALARRYAALEERVAASLRRS